MNDQSYSSASSTRSPAASALDDLVRRQLRVSDPHDAQAISLALRERYAADDKALSLEAAGMPFRLAPVEVQRPVVTSTSAEVIQARDDVGRDLEALLSDALLKDVYPELRGWAHSIRRTMADGLQAARFALDPWQRDQAMGARRVLGDYARVARFVGSLTTGVTRSYRALASSLDEVSSVILVSMGEAVAQAGYGGGRFLLQAPASELQARRDAVLNTLRTLVGSRNVPLGQADWAYGTHALRQVMDFLDQSGMTDLRALFQENYVARLLDELVQWSTRGSAEDLRALGATAQLSLGRFRRLLLVAGNICNPQSPPLAAYFDAIHSFLDAFASGAGYRLPFVGRPAIAHHGLYGTGGPDDATQRLLDIISLRGQLAQLLDCFGCSCSADDVRGQLLLDRVLFDVDRAIDLYVMGTDPQGQGLAEQRAVACALIIDELPGQLSFDQRAELGTLLVLLRDLLLRADGWFTSPDPVLLGDVVIAQPPTGPSAARSLLELLQQELCIQRDAEAQWENLLHTLAPSCFTFPSTGNGCCTVTPPNGAAVPGVLAPTQQLIEAAICSVAGALGTTSACSSLGVQVPPTTQTGIGVSNGTQDRRGAALREGVAVDSEALVENTSRTATNTGQSATNITLVATSIEGVGTKIDTAGTKIEDAGAKIDKAATNIGCAVTSLKTLADAFSCWVQQQHYPQVENGRVWDLSANQPDDIVVLKSVASSGANDTQRYVASEAIDGLPADSQPPLVLTMFCPKDAAEAQLLERAVEEINKEHGAGLKLVPRKRARQLGAAPPSSVPPPPSAPPESYENT
jgi:hypothetical protein